MADAGFYRGTSSEQDSRFTDKERKLLKQMRFEEALEQKISMDRVNLDVVKPWITAKLNEILGMEDDVLIEYVFSQLEDKALNPKVMQINLTGFLNARRAREFMGELWQILLEAQKSEDGIPESFVEKKVKELQEKAKNISLASANGTSADTAGSDWKDRYESLTGGRYGVKASEGASKGDDKKDDERRKGGRDSGRTDHRGKDADSERHGNKNDRDRRSKDYGKSRDESRGDGKSKEAEDDRGREAKYRERGDDRRRDKEDRYLSRRESRSSRSPARKRSPDEKAERRKARSYSRSPKRSPPRRRFTEKKEDARTSPERRKRKKGSESGSEEERRLKKKKKHAKHRSDSDSDRAEKKKKKHKKEKKRKKHHSSDSD